MNKNKVMKVVVFVAVMLIPLIYSFFYLKSYWNPYGNLEDLQVAVVNLDKGDQGKNQGDELVNALIDSKSIKICEVNERKAEDGLVNGKYYAKLIIPEDFTKTLNNAANLDREKAILTFSPNKKSNYLAYQIINNVITKTELSLQSKVASEVVANLKEKLEEVPTKMEEINDGVDKVLDGTNTLKEGTNTLKTNYAKFDEGVSSAYDGSVVLNNGIDTVKAGSNKLASGATLLDSSINQIKDGASALNTGATQGISQISSGVGQLVAGSNDLNSQFPTYVASVNSYTENSLNVLNGIKALGDANPTLASDPNFAPLYLGAKQILATGVSLDGTYGIRTNGNALVSGVSNLNNGINLLNDNISKIDELAAGIDTLNNAVSLLSQGSNDLKNGTISLDSGMSEVKNGTLALTNGLSILNTSSKAVKDGINSLDTGANTLNDGVNTLNTEISKGIDSTKEELKKLDGLDTYVEDPVEFKEESYGEVNEYGVSFTPLFLSIGLWVGALMAYVVLYYDLDKRYKLLGKYADNKLLQIVLYIAIAAVQGIVTGLLLKLTLGFSVENIFIYYMSCILIAITFMSIIQFLIINFGDIGKFIALIILVLQLAASGGTFPVETISKGFRVFTNMLPMTYSIRLLKESLIIQDAGFVGKNVLALLLFTLIPLAITVVVTMIKKKNNTNNIVENN